MEELHFDVDYHSQIMGRLLALAHLCNTYKIPFHFPFLSPSIATIRDLSTSFTSPASINISRKENKQANLNRIESIPSPSQRAIQYLWAPNLSTSNSETLISKMPLQVETVNRFSLLELIEPVESDDAVVDGPADKNGEVLAPKTTFLDMPRELRDLIYELALLPLHPIELAPIRGREADRPLASGWPSATGVCRPWAGYRGPLWHRCRYLTQVHPSLQLLRASKQIQIEAAPVFYGQEFRFSNSQGWHILYVWLNLIGENNRRLLRQITVTYPANTALFDKAVMQADWTWGYDHCDALELSPVPHPLPFRERYHPYYRRLHQNRHWIRQTDPTQILLSLPQLRSLGFVFFVHGKIRPFEAGPMHPIHSTDWSASPRAENIISQRWQHLWRETA